MILREVIELEAGRRHDARCHFGPGCPHRDWHIQNDFSREVARDVIAFQLAEIDNVKQYYELR